ncbi:MAG TPA: mannonate dehydratase [Bryobacteraceae bacterium]|nr:mannonate dehydratase [Bryobacteraceae bacterium]
MSTIPSRRGFLAAAVAAAATPALAAKKPLAPLSPGIKISLQTSSTLPDDELVWAKQMGIEWLNVGSGAPAPLGESYNAIVKKAEAAGLKVWNISNGSVHNMPEVTLNLPGRDAKIEEYKQFLRNLSAAGLTYTTYAHMGNGIWSSQRETTRGGAPARAFHQATAKGYWGRQTFEPPLSHGRKFTKEELWENYTYFIKQVVPVAEEVGIRIGIHPDDPPVPELGGVPRNIFGNFDGYMKALAIANSPNVGVCLCCGTWMEGGKFMGRDVFQAAREFQKLGKLWKIHFRNVTGPIPDFVETYVDDGYTDMKKLMRTLVEIDFRGNLIADHVPEMKGGRYAGWSYSLGYIKALYDMARSEKGRG